MDDLEMIKFAAMVIAIIAFINFPIILKKRKDFAKFLPGIKYTWSQRGCIYSIQSI